MTATVHPRLSAAHLVAEHADEPDWLDAFSEALDHQRGGRSLQRSLDVWGVSQAELASMLGVSRQAVGKWIERGIPPERAPILADLAAATDLLVRHLRRDRIPAVVRRPAAKLGGRSLLDLVGAGQSAAALAACRAMFDIAAVPG